MLEHMLLFFVGLIIGALSGLIPGLHPNFISAIAILQSIDYEKKAIFIISMYSSHILFSFIPAIFFNIPEERTLLSVLPGHRMVQEGKGLLALKIVIVSTLFGAVLSTLFLPVALQLYSFLYTALLPHIGILLLLFSLILILKTKNPFHAFLIFLLSGFLGIYAFQVNIHDPFLSLFCGFFTMATVCVYKKSKIPKQQDSPIATDAIKFIIIGVFLGALANLLPAISSPAQVATVVSLFLSFETPHYLAILAAINIGQFVFSFASIASIEKARHGVMANLDKIMEVSGNTNMLLFYFILGLVLSTIILFIIRKKIAVLAHVDFSKFNKLLVLYLLIVIFLINGFSGVLIFAASSLIGYITIQLNVERTVMMGALILPTILLFIF